MIKTLSISVADPDNADHLTIAGTQKDEFNPLVIISVGSSKIALNSQDLALALKTVVDFQTPPMNVTQTQLFDEVLTAKNLELKNETKVL